jgi:hypothetical protein
LRAMRLRAVQIYPHAFLESVVHLYKYITNQALPYESARRLVHL